MIHSFTNVILHILHQDFGDDAQQIFERSLLLQYLNAKTRSANKGAKARGSFASHYAIYVLVEDYINKGYSDANNGSYNKYEGAKFTDLLKRQRQLPFGSKLQNHALNSRVNGEFAKLFPTTSLTPILRDQQTQRYWINEQLIQIVIDRETTTNIARSIIRIIDAYVEAKRTSFETFIQACQRIEQLSPENEQEAVDFITEQLRPNVDARIFEVVSFAILKAYYSEHAIYWGWTLDDIQGDTLTLYKTGRTNANDGGIDFVMRPLGRFFQVTETLDVKKYFLDIDKIQRFPITFVVKSEQPVENIREQLRSQAERDYGVITIVNRYMEAVEEIINSPELLARFSNVLLSGKLKHVMDEIVLQSRAEFNYDDNEPEFDDSTDER